MNMIKIWWYILLPKLKTIPIVSIYYVFKQRLKFNIHNLKCVSTIILVQS
jgi:hypothetical protein